MPSYGNNSLKNLEFVTPDLRFIFMEYIKRAKVDISIVCGIRTLEEQTKNFESGFSQTMKSMHLPQEDGLSWAVDFYPWVDKKSCHKEYFYRQVQARLHEIANYHQIPITFGGLWSSFEEVRDGRIQYGDNCHVEKFKPKYKI